MERSEEEERSLNSQAWGALNFILAFYEPQNYLDTNAWKQAEALGRSTRTKLREWLDRPENAPGEMETALRALHEKLLTASDLNIVVYSELLALFPKGF